jgi:hypothetical protein
MTRDDADVGGVPHPHVQTKHTTRKRLKKWLSGEDKTTLSTLGHPAPLSSGAAHQRVHQTHTTAKAHDARARRAAAFTQEPHVATTDAARDVTLRSNQPLASKQRSQRPTRLREAKKHRHAQTHQRHSCRTPASNLQEHARPRRYLTTEDRRRDRKKKATTSITRPRHRLRVLRPLITAPPRDSNSTETWDRRAEADFFLFLTRRRCRHLGRVTATSSRDGLTESAFRHFTGQPKDEKGGRNT